MATEQQVEAPGNEAMDRYLTPLDVWAMAFGCMVGWGAFVMPGTTFLPIAGPAGTTIALIIGMAITLVIGANFSYLMTHNTRTGGVYSFTKDAFGRDHAFLCTWFLCLSYLTIVFLNGTAIFVVIRTMFHGVLHFGAHYTIAGNDIFLGEVAVSAIALGGVGMLFVFAKPFLQRLLTILSLVLLIGTAIISFACLPHAFSNGSFGTFGTMPLSKAQGIFTIVVLSPWAFVGFDVVSFDTAHFAFDTKRCNWLTPLTIILGALAYITMMLVSIAALPEGYASWQEYISALEGLSGVESVPAFYAAQAIMGKVGLTVAVVSALASILTGIIGAYRASMRVLATMAEDHILSQRFTDTTYSILFIMVISILLALLGRNTLNWFVDLTAFGAIVGFGYTSAAAYKMARTRGNTLVSVTGMVGAVTSVVLGLVQLVPRVAALEAMGAEAFLLLSLWCLMGFVFYWRTMVDSPSADYRGISTSGTVLFVMLLYSALMWLGKRIAATETVEEVRANLLPEGIIVLTIIFVGLAVMLYLQNMLRLKHDESERGRIRAMEGSLAKSQFLFNMSHDIRTPMNAIIGYTNLALQEPASQEVHDYLGKIDTSSRHLLALINDILEMSRIESGKLELEYVPTDLIKLFEGIRDLFSEQMRQKGIAFSVFTSQVHNPFVWCDGKNLNRVLLNVISNAYKFTPEDGTVSVGMWEIASGEGGYETYEIRVQDSGIGMSKEFAEKMFIAFERERTSTVSGVEGTGLGLAITKSIIDLMGGTIDVATSPGSGTEMIMRLKMRLATESEVRAVEKGKEEHVASTDFSGKRVLLVEDQPINMEIAQMILTRMGFEVETAENGQVAVDAVKNSGVGHFDAILMDIQMPVMDGYAATKAIRSLDDKRLATIPIVAMTANAFKEDEEASARVGMQGHIAKPIDVAVMTQTLADVLD
ncbi:MAG: amino acid permease, partial [Atopobiaceae bacterium]|nr:amino acid permease [Atopobiaceae bacterium]